MIGLGIAEILSIVGIGHSYYSNIKLGKKVDLILDKVDHLENVIKLSDRLLYYPKTVSANHQEMKVETDLRKVREELGFLEKISKSDKILATALITSSSEIKNILKNQNPHHVFDSVNTVNESRPHTNPDMVPVLFHHNGQRLIGWKMKGLMPNLFGVELDSGFDFSFEKSGIEDSIPTIKIGTQVWMKFDLNIELSRGRFEDSILYNWGGAKRASERVTGFRLPNLSDFNYLLARGENYPASLSKFPSDFGLHPMTLKRSTCFWASDNHGRNAPCLNIKRTVWNPDVIKYQIINCPKKEFHRIRLIRNN